MIRPEPQDAFPNYIPTLEDMAEWNDFLMREEQRDIDSANEELASAETHELDMYLANRELLTVK